MLDRYFDHAATTPVDSRVREAMMPWLSEDCGNANSLHSFGLRARAAVERARSQLATLLRVEPEEIVFTSGATEANNWLISNFASSTIAISPFEHSAVREPALLTGARILSNDHYELSPSEADLTSVMAVNNETGAIIQFPTAVGLKHSDITQAAGKISLDLSDLHFASLSGHKFFGPKGVGALILRHQSLAPLLKGGEQEWGLRAGTLDVPAIVGFGEAAEIAEQEMEANRTHAQSLRSAFLEALPKGEHVIHEVPAQLPQILSLSFEDLEGQSLVVAMDAAGFAISSGAACSAGSTEPSHVLQALQVPAELIRGTVRISFGPANTLESTNKLAESMNFAVEKLRAMRRNV